MNDPIRLGQSAVPSVDRSRGLIEKMLAAGKFSVQHVRAGEIIGEYECHNAIVNEGMNDLLDVVFNGGTQVALWYIGLVDNDGFSSFNNADTAAQINGTNNWGELTSYTEGTRPQWTVGSPSGRSITNASTVDFSINATETVHGIFIVSDDTKAGTGGELWSTAAFGSNVSVQSGDTLKITYTVTG